MVYLIEKCKEETNNLLFQQNIQSAFYLYYKGKQIDFTLVGGEALALKGFVGEKILDHEIKNQLSYEGKRNQIDNNIFKLIGFYIGSNNHPDIETKVLDKYNKTSAENKYLLHKVFPNLISKDDLVSYFKNNKHPIINDILELEVDEKEQIEFIKEFIVSSFGVTELILLEDFIDSNMNIKYTNLSAVNIVKQVLLNFPEAIKKIKNRRKGKNIFEFNDEYDVQDVLYVMLKAIFPKLKEEDPVPKHGSNSTRIDLNLRDEKILVEVKMIKASDNDERKFIKELKEDIQSYHMSQWIEHLICFIYDPYDKTKDKNNFYELNGEQSINGKSFQVEVILVK